MIVGHVREPLEKDMVLSLDMAIVNCSCKSRGQVHTTRKVLDMAKRQVDDTTSLDGL